MAGLLVYDVTDDSAVVYAMGACFICERIFSFHPNHVPSVRIGVDGHPDPVNGERKPICKECILMGNEKRRELKLPPHVIHPLAYEQASESTINWHDRDPMPQDAAKPARQPVYTPPPWERPHECVNECNTILDCIRRPECGINQW